jgi:hypothetical protein
MALVMLDRWLLWECCFELVNTSVHDLVTPGGGGWGCIHTLKQQAFFTHIYNTTPKPLQNKSHIYI